MQIEKFKLLIDTFNLTEKELIVFLHNYRDSFIFNEYLYNSFDYVKLNFLSNELIENLVTFFNENKIEKNMIKKIIISAPMIFSCDNFNQQLDIVYKDSNLEGIIIVDNENNKHPYRIKNNLRSITENQSILDDLIVSSENDYKKVYYTKSKKNY